MSWRCALRCLLIRAALALLFLALGAPPSLVEGQDFTFRRGDINGDDARDISDPVALLIALFVPGQPPLPCEKAADANDDGVLDLADVITLLALLFQSAAPLPPPDLCGVDPTPDPLTCVSSPTGCPPDLSIYQALLEPPSPPPAAPCGCFYEDGGVNSAAHMILRHSGEVTHVETDLFLRGRGIDFAFTRTYRSRLGESTAMGHRWTHSYDLRVTSTSAGVVLRDGHGRVDLLTLQTDGTYGAPGHFTSGSFDAFDRFVLAFGDGGSWQFHPAQGLPQSGKIDQIADRHGNALVFAYDPAGRLSAITDTLGHVHTLAYDAPGRIASLTDFDGRTVTYSYYGPGDPSGSEGDLAAMTSPAVVGTPTLNDFPAGKTTAYTYSTGFADDRLNHDLLSITDPKGQKWIEFGYSTSCPSCFPFGRMLFSSWQGGAARIDLDYATVVPDPGNHGAVLRVIENDRRGAVDEYYYDAQNRLVLLREFTGFADPMLPTTETENRPTGKLRSTDPDFYETRPSYDPDHLVTEVVHATGAITQHLYESALIPGGPRVSRGNLRQLTRLAGSHLPIGSQDILVTTLEYEPGYGGCCAEDFLTAEIDPAGRTTEHVFDAAGNRIQTIHPDPSVVEDFAYDSFGELVLHVLPDNGAGVRRNDVYVYGTVGSSLGRLVSETADSLGTPLTTQYEHDSRGNVVALTDPAGATNANLYNELDQRVLELSPVIDPTATVPIVRTFYYDANDNLVRTCTENRDENGALDPTNSYLTTLYEYDSLDRRVRTCEESGSFDVPISPPQLDCQGLPSSEFVTTEYEYDPSGNRTRVLLGEATRGAQPGNTIEFVHDELDRLYLRSRQNGSVIQADYDYTEVRRLRDGVVAPRTWLFTYDPFERLVSARDPMGNLTSYLHDPSRNVVHEQTDGERLDLPGQAGNVRLREVTTAFGDLSRPGGGQFLHFDPATQAPLTDGASSWSSGYAPISRITSLTDDDGAVTTYEYDSHGRLVRAVDAMGNEDLFSYDPRGSVVARTEIDLSTDPTVPAETYITAFAYDDLGRLISVTDPAGGVETFAYDSRNNRVRRVDARGNVTRSTYDSLDRLVAEVFDLTNTGDGTGTVVATATTQYQWDASSRLVAVTDPNGNTTTFAYDESDRRVLATSANGVEHTLVWNSFDDLVSATDPNGTVVQTTYDNLGRPTLRTILPGPGVSPATTFEEYAYDGLSRLVRAADDDSEVLRNFDSLGNLMSEVQNGRVVTYLHSGSGNRLSMTYPGGRGLDFAYDALARPTTITDPTTGPIITTTEYIGDRLLRQTDATDTTSDHHYDRQRRVEFIGHSQGATAGPPVQIDARGYAWDPVSNKIARDRTGPGSPIFSSLTYDSLDRLVRTLVTDDAGLPVRDTQYTLDLSGNRLEVTSGSCTGPYLLDPAAGGSVHQYAQTGCDLRSYDLAGNLLSRTPFGAPGAQFSYDDRDRMVGAVDPFSGTYTYEHDALGRRIASTHTLVAGSSRTEYLYDGPHVIEERDAVGAILATYVLSNPPDDNRIQMRRDLGAGPEDFYLRSEDLGSVVVLCDAAGAPVERYEYDDYGAPSFSDAAGIPLPGSLVGNPYLFHGLRYRAESGGYEADGRSLDPLAGRFVDVRTPWPDPYLQDGTASSMTGYDFAGNNPWSRGDATSDGQLLRGAVVGFESGHETGFESVAVSGYDLTHRLTRGRKSKTWQNQSDSDGARSVGPAAASAVSSLRGLPGRLATAGGVIPGGAVISSALPRSSSSRVLLNGPPLEYRAEFPEPPPWWRLQIGEVSAGPPTTGRLLAASNGWPVRWEGPELTRKRPGRTKYSNITLKRSSHGHEPGTLKGAALTENSNILLRRGNHGHEAGTLKRPGRTKYSNITLKRGYVHDGLSLFLELGPRLQSAGGMFNTISNMQKARHDAMMATIQNAR